MQDRIKAAFDGVRAEDALKEATRRFLAAKTATMPAVPLLTGALSRS